MQDPSAWQVDTDKKQLYKGQRPQIQHSFALHTTPFEEYIFTQITNCVLTVTEYYPDQKYQLPAQTDRWTAT